MQLNRLKLMVKTLKILMFFLFIKESWKKYQDIHKNIPLYNRFQHW